MPHRHVEPLAAARGAELAQLAGVAAAPALGAVTRALWGEPWAPGLPARGREVPKKEREGTGRDGRSKDDTGRAHEVKGLRQPWLQFKAPKGDFLQAPFLQGQRGGGERARAAGTFVR